MHRSESDELLSCIACGAVIDPRERVYGFGADAVLCFPCGVQRGGAYEAAQGRWTHNPNVSDVAEPER